MGAQSGDGTHPEIYGTVFKVDVCTLCELTPITFRRLAKRLPDVPLLYQKPSLP
jgi:hypothetical protein